MILKLEKTLSFSFQPAAQQAITAEVCTCLERLVGNLGDIPPLTPPPPSPRMAPSPVFNDYHLQRTLNYRLRRATEDIREETAANFSGGEENVEDPNT